MLNFLNHIHLPITKEIFNFIANLDLTEANDYFCWKSGGDGDNGEVLMNELDEFFSTHEMATLNHGYWIEHTDEFYGTTTECSHCHIEGLLYGNYCPECGSKMDM